MGVLVSKNKDYIDGLNSLRFFAFSLVFLSHIQYHFSEISNIFFLGVKEFFKIGYLGVDLFFVLSAFLLTSITFKEIEKSGVFSLKKYFKRRSLRILPLYLFILLITFSIPFLQNFIGIKESLLPPLYQFITFQLNFTATNGDQFLMVILWSISIEVQFYILNGIILRFFRKHFLLFNVLLIITSLIFRYANIENPLALHYHSLSLFSCFAIGNLLAILLHKKSKWMFNKTTEFIGVSIICLLLIFYPKLQEIRLIYWLEKIIYPLCFAFLIYLQTKAGLFNLQANKKINFLGEISYGLYCYHGFSIAILTILVNNYIKTANQNTIFISWLILPLASFLLTLSLSIVSYHFFEKRFLKLK